LRADGLGFYLGIAVVLGRNRSRVESAGALGLAFLAALRLVAELLVVKKQLS